MALDIKGLFNPTSVSIPTSHLAEIMDGGEEPTDSFTVTKNLSHCAISNEQIGKTSYYAEIAPTGGWSDLQVTIKVGGVDMSEYYSSGVINIPNVTGNIVITATAAAAPLTSITATYTQSGTVYDSDSLDSLRTDLVVTANYDNSTSEVVTTYTLSGTLTEGTSTITVSYEGKTATFSVVVDENPLPDGYTLYDYVTADGTQYIQTQITEPQAFSWASECKVSANPTTQGNGHILSSQNTYFPFLGYNPTSDPAYFSTQKRFGNEQLTIILNGNGYSPNVPYKLVAYQNGASDVYIYDMDGNVKRHITIASGGSSVSSNKFAFFTYGGNVSTTKYRFKGNFYYLKLSDSNGQLVHHYLPCKNASNVVGLYDVITSTFLAPTAGTLTGHARG